MKKRKKSSNKGKMIVLIVLSFIVILAIGGYFYFVYTISAVDKDNKTDIYIKVKQGETMSSLADELKKKRFDSSTAYFHVLCEILATN